MAQEESVGIFLALQADRDMLHAAAIACGLRSVDLPNTTSTPPLPHMPALIVTDQPTGPWLPASGTSFSQYDAPVLLQVGDSDATDARNDPTSATPAFALHRPMRLESVTAALKQAVSMTHSFRDRHSSMIGDLEHCRRIFDSVTNGITICDANVAGFPLTYVNPAFERITGYSAAEVCGRNCKFLQGTDTRQPALEEVRQSLRDGTDARVVLRNYRKDGTLFWNEFYLSPIRDPSLRITHFVGIQNDVTRQVEAINLLQHLAHHDALTGLANRAYLMTQLEQAIQQARRNHATLAVLFFDLNKFKQVNDIFGHDAGDQLLLVVAERLRSVARGAETVARLGGDEFVVVLEDINAGCQPDIVMRRLLEKLQEPTTILGSEIYPGASVGMAIYPKDGETAEELLKSADFNMYLAKHDLNANPPPLSLAPVPRLTSRLRNLVTRARA